MNQNLRDEINRLHAQVCAGLSDPTRILILYALSEQAQTVGELAQKLNLPQPTTSRHLKILRDRNLVLSQRDGPYVYYRIRDDRIIEALDLLREVLADILKDTAALMQSIA